MTFETFQKIFFFAVAAFIVFGLISVLLTKWRWDHERETRQQRLAETTRAPQSESTPADGALHSTFGLSGQSASDSTPAGSFGDATFDSSDCGPGDLGGGDCGDTGGGDSGGGGWSD